MITWSKFRLRALPRLRMTAPLVLGALMASSAFAQGVASPALPPGADPYMGLPPSSSFVGSPHLIMGPTGMEMPDMQNHLPQRAPIMHNARRQAQPLVGFESPAHIKPLLEQQYQPTEADRQDSQLTPEQRRQVENAQDSAEQARWSRPQTRQEYARNMRLPMKDLDNAGLSPIGKQALLKRVRELEAAPQVDYSTRAAGQSGRMTSSGALAR